MSILHRPTGIDFGRPIRVVRLWGERYSQRFDVKTITVCLVVAVLALLVGLITLASGEYQLSIGEVAGALIGQATGRVHMVVVEWRLPRTGMALLLGAALGLSGAIFQSLTRNPLGSPDVIGFDAGSYTGALIVIIVLQGSYYQIAGGALAGGVLTATLVYALAFRRGVQGFRLIVVGIGVSAMMSSFNVWLMLRADLQVAMAAAVWGAGTLNGMSLERFGSASVVLALLIPLSLYLSGPLRQLEMGDDAARALGINAERTRLVLLVVGVALTATVTAAAGPIMFVALAAPQIARRLTGAAGVSPVPAAATGALLLAVADFGAQRAFAPTQLPVGIVTVSLGGLYFAWLLIREARRD